MSHRRIFHAYPYEDRLIDSCVIQLAVMALRSVPEREPIRARALGIFQVSRFTSWSSRVMASRYRRC